MTTNHTSRCVYYTIVYYISWCYVTALARVEKKQTAELQEAHKGKRGGKNRRENVQLELVVSKRKYKLLYAKRVTEAL